MYTLEEVSRMLGVPVRTLRRMANDGALHAQKFGRRWFITLSGLQASPAIWDSLVLLDQYADYGHSGLSRPLRASQKG